MSRRTTFSLLPHNNRESINTNNKLNTRKSTISTRLSSGYYLLY